MMRLSKLTIEMTLMAIGAIVLVGAMMYAIHDGRASTCVQTVPYLDR